jgi:hypothetical protein
MTSGSGNDPRNNKPADDDGLDDFDDFDDFDEAGELDAFEDGDDPFDDGSESEIDTDLDGDLDEAAEELDEMLSEPAPNMPALDEDDFGDEDDDFASAGGMESDPQAPEEAAIHEADFTEDDDFGAPEDYATAPETASESEVTADEDDFEAGDFEADDFSADDFNPPSVRGANLTNEVEEDASEDDFVDDFADSDEVPIAQAAPAPPASSGEGDLDALLSARAATIADEAHAASGKTGFFQHGTKEPADEAADAMKEDLRAEEAEAFEAEEDEAALPEDTGSSYDAPTDPDDSDNEEDGFELTDDPADDDDDDFIPSGSGVASMGDSDEITPSAAEIAAAGGAAAGVLSGVAEVQMNDPASSDEDMDGFDDDEEEAMAPQPKPQPSRKKTRKRPRGPAIPLIDVGEGGFDKVALAYPKRLRAIHALAEKKLFGKGLGILDNVCRKWATKGTLPYRLELDGVSAALDGDPGAYLINLAFEMGCTTGAIPDPEGGMRLLHTMDWNLEGLGRMFVAARRHAPAGLWVNITWPGYVGCLQGVAPGRFAAAINHAPLPAKGPPAIAWPLSKLRWYGQKGIPPSFLLRKVFDECPDFYSAIEMIEKTPICYPAIFSILGPEEGEFVIIERTEAAKSTQKRAPAVTNHWLNKEFSGTVTAFQSNERLVAMKSRITKGINDSEWLAHPILNADTRIAVDLNPVTGRMRLRGYNGVEPATALLDIYAD